MFRIAVCVSVGLFFVAVGLCVGGFDGVDACSSSGNHVDWADSPELIQGSEGESDSTFDFHWNFEETPFMGQAKIDPVATSTNIATVAYTPEYFFATSCEQTVEIDVHGEFANDEVDGVLVTFGEMWDSGDPPPYDSASHTAGVDCCP